MWVWGHALAILLSQYSNYCKFLLTLKKKSCNLFIGPHSSLSCYTEKVPIPLAIVFLEFENEFELPVPI